MPKEAATSRVLYDELPPQMDLPRNAAKTYTHRTQMSQTEELMDADGKISQDDIQFLNILENGVTQHEGHYSFPLPFREVPILPDNQRQAEKLLQQLVKIFQRDPAYYDEYAKYMAELFQLGHAEVVSEDNPGQCWYIPHFGVRHPKKNKLRVVFDASAHYQGMSINDHLLQGPDQMNNLTDEDLTPTKTCRMTVHLFEASSSPGVAAFGLKKVAKDNQHISTDAAKFLYNDFYVDDGLMSVSNTEAAKALIRQAVEICRKANLRLHKFISNSEKVLSAIPHTETVSQHLNILSGSTQRVLGLEWSVKNDSFRFLNNLKPKPATRRGIFSVVSQIYDPLGFLAPFILTGKNILRRVNQAGLNWDAPVSEDMNKEWQRWLQQLDDLQEISIQRCYKPKDFGTVVRTELHHFCDASTHGLRACSYLRLISDVGNVCCILVLAKSKVAPSKSTTIPRLELQSAVIASRLSSAVKLELKQEIDQEYFWSDSKIAPGYIQNSSRCFYVYVANRVQEVRDKTHPEQWRHVSTEDNPADMASRGLMVNALKQIEANKTFKLKLKTPTIFQREEAQKLVIKITQKEHFRAEYLALQKEESLPKNSFILALNPFLDDAGLLRVGGRASKATHLLMHEKHPILIPKNSFLAKLLMQNAHDKAILEEHKL
ncbi:uncharacterized protein [Watersipora subatra]|uniref:uncharacterized protein n=1 Tax=Watersipora subatra TaxID=2589382 RepID=UPI00355C1EEA